MPSRETNVVRWPADSLDLDPSAVLVGKARSLSEAELLASGPGAFAIMPPTLLRGVTTWAVYQEPSDAR